jgi:Fe-S cluster assembly protein SufB
MAEDIIKPNIEEVDLGDYQFGFHDDVTPIYSTGRGLTEDVVRAMSAEKEEPEWMLEFRLKSLETFNKMAMPKSGGQTFLVLTLMI